MKTGRGWGIECENGDICDFAENIKDRLEDFEDDTSKAIRVRILKESDYRKLVKNQKEQAK